MKWFRFNKKKIEINASSVNIAEYLREAAKHPHQSKITAYTRQELANKLEEFEKAKGIEPLTSVSLTESVTLDFIDFLEQKQLSRNSIVSIINRLKNILRRISVSGYYVDVLIFSIRLMPERKKVVFLTEKEIEILFFLKLQKPLNHVRDLFIIGCYTGLRFSDFKRITKEHIDSGIISILQQKTRKQVSVPVHWMVRKIMQKNNYKLAEIEVCPATFNRYIRKICRIAGFDSDILIESTQGKAIQPKEYKKWEKISSHTARRSFATNMDIAKIPEKSAQLFTGHSSVTSYEAYVQNHRERAAQEFKNHIFFTGGKPMEEEMNHIDLRKNLVTNETLIKKLQVLAEKLNRSPYQFEVPLLHLYRSRFGLYNNALKLAGLSQNRCHNYTKEELIKFLQDFAVEHGRLPCRSDHRVYKIPVATTYFKIFQVEKWSDVLLAAGFPEQDIKKEKVTRKELINSIIKFFDENGKVPSAFNCKLPYHYKRYMKVLKCNTWAEVIMTAGLRPTRTQIVRAKKKKAKLRRK